MNPLTSTLRMLALLAILSTVFPFSHATAQNIIHLDKHRYEYDEALYKYEELGPVFQIHTPSFDQFNAALKHHDRADTWKKVSLGSLGIGVTLFAIYGFDGFELGELETDAFLVTTLFIFPVSGVAAIIRTSNCRKMRSQSVQTYNQYQEDLSENASRVEIGIGLLSNGRAGLSLKF